MQLHKTQLGLFLIQASSHHKIIAVADAAYLDTGGVLAAVQQSIITQSSIMEGIDLAYMPTSRQQGIVLSSSTMFFF